MREGTTPTLRCSINEYDLTEVTYFITLCNSKNEKKTFTNTDENVVVSYIEGVSHFDIYLTQADTFWLGTGVVTIQIRWIDSNNEAYATDEASFNVRPVMLKQVIEYSGGGHE